MKERNMQYIKLSSEPKALQRFVYLLAFVGAVFGGNSFSIYMDKGWSGEFIQCFFYTGVMLGLILIVIGVAKILEVLEKHAVNMQQRQADTHQYRLLDGKDVPV